MGSNNYANESVLIKLGGLEEEFNNTMITYTQARLDYISALKNNTRNFSTFPKSYHLDSTGRTLANYNAVGGIQSADKCKALCSADIKCVGATYYAQPQHCYMNSGGVGTIVPYDYPNQTLTAMKPDVTQHTNNLDVLNNKLTDLYQQIDTTTKQIKLDGKANITSKLNLTDIHSKLENDKKTIMKLKKEYSDISREYQDTHINVVQENSVNSTWIFFTLVAVAVTTKVVFFSK